MHRGIRGPAPFDGKAMASSFLQTGQFFRWMGWPMPRSFHLRRLERNSRSHRR